MVDLDALERLAKDAPAVLTLADSGQYGRLRAALDGDTVLSLVQAVRAALALAPAATNALLELGAPKIEISLSYEDLIEAIDETDRALAPFRKDPA